MKSPLILKLKLLCFCACISLSKISSQSKGVQKIQDSVFELNKKSFFTLSQNILDGIIKHDTTSPDTKIYLYLSKGDTYKFTNDYANVERMLDSASAIQNNNKPLYFKTLITYNRALVLFDNRKYEATTKLLNTLEENLSLLNYNAQSNIETMVGYWAYVNRQFSEAEDHFKNAISILLDNEDTVHLPLVYQKQMSLYARMNKQDLYKTAFKKAMYYADLHGIEKYKTTTLLILNDLIANPEHFKTFTKNQKQNLYNSLKAAVKDQKSSNTTNTYLAALGVLISVPVMSVLLYFRKQRVKSTRSTETNTNTAPTPTIIKEKHAFILNQLNDRQAEIIKLVIEGKSNAEIAKTLHLSTSTIKYHLSNIYDILDIKNRIDLFTLLNKNDN